MRDNKHPFNEKTRSVIRSKRRKTNIILNSLIIIVLLLIIFVSAKIFMGSEETVSEKRNLAGADSSIIADRVDATADNEAEKSEQPSEKSVGDSEKEDKKKNVDKEKEEIDKDKKEKDKDDADKEEKIKDKDKPEVDGEEIVTEGGNNPDVKKTIVNPAWEPLETSQETPNPNEYGGQNWDEMVQAITYATGIDESNMTIIFLGNNGPNKSVGTILQKDTKQKYRVYIDWVDGIGWQPTTVEELNE